MTELKTMEPKEGTPLTMRELTKVKAVVGRKHFKGRKPMPPTKMRKHLLNPATMLGEAKMA